MGLHSRDAFLAGLQQNGNGERLAGLLVEGFATFGSHMFANPLQLVAAAGFGNVSVHWTL